MFAIQNTGHQLINRGDPDGADFDKNDLTADGDIHELDLSSIIPPNAFAVVLYIKVCTVNPDIGKGITFRKKGDNTFYNGAVNYVNVAAKPKYVQGLCFVDADRIIEYQASNYTFWNLAVTVAAYWTK